MATVLIQQHGVTSTPGRRSSRTMMTRYNPQSHSSVLAQPPRRPSLGSITDRSRPVQRRHRRRRSSSNSGSGRLPSRSSGDYGFGCTFHSECEETPRNRSCDLPDAVRCSQHPRVNPPTAQTWKPVDASTRHVVGAPVHSFTNSAVGAFGDLLPSTKSLLDNSTPEWSRLGVTTNIHGVKSATVSVRIRVPGKDHVVRQVEITETTSARTLVSAVTARVPYLQRMYAGETDRFEACFHELAAPCRAMTPLARPLAIMLQWSPARLDAYLDNGALVVQLAPKSSTSELQPSKDEAPIRRRVNTMPAAPSRAKPNRTEKDLNRRSAPGTINRRSTVAKMFRVRRANTV